MAQPDSKPREWHRQRRNQNFLVSTSTAHLDLDFINDAFASDDMYWAKRLPEDQLTTLIAHSITLGLYVTDNNNDNNIPAPKTTSSPSSPRTPSPTDTTSTKPELQQIGLARFITDHITTAYLTDVYILPSHRGLGLFQWLISCCKEVIAEHPALRRAFLVASPDVGRRFYERELGFWDVGKEGGICFMTRSTFTADH